MPGTLPVNATFVLSILCGIAAGVLQGKEEKKLRAADTRGIYPPTLGDFGKAMWKRWREGKVKVTSIRALQEAQQDFNTQTEEWYEKKESARLKELSGNLPAEHV